MEFCYTIYNTQKKIYIASCRETQEWHLNFIWNNWNGIENAWNLSDTLSFYSCWLQHIDNRFYNADDPYDNDDE